MLIFLQFLANVNSRIVSFTFAICYHRSVCLSVVCLSVCNVGAPYTQPVEIFGNLSSAFGTMAIR